ncbi:effector binding domain-containing protein [Neolewinella antarctica]|uniref:DNA-binding transcriptional regulator YafY/putative transcriptional regulator YdeE n=1 Tax=Neolewinella antarctica TaxID=442734 RepID=A0ABX0XFA7_9BACT|nr:effector binding domain-containing protein [Neolewinella antarctica]NJC27589.1 putative DNA-binding transcriptional regulator YafY/putative transcriptional regulator YdeE [Neolewinella antarctica]
MPNRLTRLTTLLTQLQSSRLVTARQLADRHGVSLRTVYRDVRALEAAGVPIVTVEGKGYSILAGYRLPPIMFTEAEAGALITAEHLIGKNSDASLVRAYQSAITKIKAVLPSAGKERSEVLSSRLLSRDDPAERPTSNLLMVIQECILHHRLSAIAYTSVKGEASNREVEPFGLYTTEGNWILIAFCRLRKAFRTFRLDRIGRFRALSTTFTPYTFTLAEYLVEARKNYSRTLATGLSQRPANFVGSPNKTTMTKQQKDSFQLIGISVRTSNTDPQQTAKDIGGLWQRLLEEQLVDQIPNKVDTTVYSVYTDYESDHRGAYTTVLGCRVSSLADVPEGMTAIEVAGGAFQVFTSRGNLQHGVVYQTWEDIWATELDRSYRADYEVYGAKASNLTDAEVEIFVGILEDSNEVPNG